MKKMWLVLLLLWPSLCCAQSLWLNLHAKGKNVEITAVKVGNFRVRPTSPELENSVQEGWKVVAKDAFGKALAHTVLVDERHVNEESFEQNGTIRSVADTHRTEGDVEGIVPFGPTLAKIEIFRIDAGKGITAGNASSNPVAVLDRQAIERIRDRTARSAVSSKPDPVVSLSSNRKARSGRKPMVIVFVGEGYTGPEMGAYRSAVDKAVATILSSYVFDAVKDDIGLERIDHVSAVSGHPSPGCDMCISTARQRAIANEALGVDGYDVLVDLVNANGRAHAIVGSGALVAFSGDLYSTNPNSIVHELGHALFGLDDEYAKGACASTMEPNTPNTTLEKDPAKIKWRQLITPGTPVPTTTGNLPPGTIGLYPVEPTCPDRGKYKPILGSMMNVNLDEWGAVNLQQILKVYAVYFGDVGNIVFPLEVKIKEMGENPPKTHNKGDAVTLMAGSQSLPDPSASPLTYTWKIPPQIQAQVDGRTIHFTIPVSGALAEYAFEATASDGKRSGSAAEVVKVNGGIAVPKAVLAGPSSVRAGQTFTYGGGGSQGGPLTYTWSLPGFTIVDASRPVERKVTAPSTPGIYEVQMTVRNNAGLTDTATHRQVVTESNAEGEPITASLNVPKEVKAGDALWALVDARSATNKPLTYSWAWTSADTAPVGQKFVDLGPSGQNHKNLQAAIFGVDVPATISVTIRDGTHEKTLTEPVLIKAEAVKAEITAVSQVQVGGPLALSAANSKGTGLTFSWSAPGFTPSSAAGENVTLTAPATAGSRQVQLTARSANGVAGTATHTVEVSANVPLTAKLVAPTTVVSGSQVPVNALVTHAPGRTLTYTWVATTPGLSGTVGNTPSGAYTAAVVSKNTIASIRLDVSDGQTTVRTPWHDVTITPPGATQPPTGTVSGPSTLDAGAQGTFTVSATDPQGGALSYAWTKPANWSGTVGNTANVTLTAPNVTQDTGATVAVTVTNAAGKTLALSHAVTVKASVAGEPITATLIVPANVNVGESLPVRVDAKSATGKRLSYTWYRTSAYFAGSIGNNPSGTYTATAEGAGKTSSVYVQISDGANTYTTPKQSVTIAPVAEVKPPTGTVSGPSTLMAGAQGSFTVSATDPQGGALTYAWTKPADWSGAVSTSANATFTAPNVAQNTHASIVVKVTNAAGKTLDLSHTVTVTAALPPTGQISGPGTLNAGQAGTFAVTASDPQGGALTYSWTRPSNWSGTVGNTANVTLTAPDVTQDANVTVAVTVTNAAGKTLGLSHAVTVKAPAGEPITATLIVPATVKVGDALPVRVDAKSATDKRLSYTWYRTSAYFAGTIGNNPSGTYTATEAGAGTTSSVYVQISDGTNSYTTPRQSVTILANAGGGGTTCYPSWSSTQVYGTISSSSPAARVSYQGRNYEQQHWTQNQNPAQLNGVGQPWKDLGPCQ